MLHGLVSAFRTITAIPVPGQDCEKAEDSLGWFPVVGLFLGGAAVALVLVLARWSASLSAPVLFLYPLLVGALVTSLWAGLTRGFHLDGLADMCDGFGGGWTPERALEIMRDSHIGAFGVIALCLALVVKVMAVAMVVASQHWWALAAAPIVSRLAIVYQASFNDYARRKAAKVSMANHFIDRACGRHFAGAAVCALICLAVVYWALGAPLLGLGQLLTAAALVAWAVGYQSRRKVNGVTGDILGATGELTEIAALICAGLLG